MISTTHMEPVANTLLILTNVLSAVKIDNLVVPEVVASDSEAVVECAYSEAGEDVTVLWLLQGARVFEWRRGARPLVSGLLDGKLYTNITGGNPEKVSLRIVRLTPELSGGYTCVVRSRGVEARETKTMTVFSPEQDFELTYNSSSDSGTVDIKCSAKHLYPQPDLTIEYNKVPISQQQQRTWREGGYFEARAAAALARAALRPRAALACRLRLPQVAYTAITTKLLHYDNRISIASTLSSPSYFLFGIIIVLHNFK